VSDAINLLASETGTVLQQVTRIANRVEKASNAVRDQAGLVNNTAERERNEVEGMILGIGDAVEKLQNVADLADQSNQAAARATDTTLKALTTVENTVSGMAAIRETITETEKRIKRLGDRSKEISGIVNLINTIAERTHVLALNASIQAAAAGEAGRGFAVVAQEVRKLAEGAREATAQIVTLVNNIQIETEDTINTMAKTITQVAEGSGQAEQAGEQMRATQATTADLVRLVQQIAQAAQEQLQVADNLRDRVTAIGESVITTAEQIQVQTAETENLVGSAKQLVESVGVFKLPEMEGSVSQDMRAAA
jgi:methyl-accepting chemotaxis protein